MKLLAIETASLSGGVALMEEKGLIAEYRLNVSVQHSERLLVVIDHLLKQSRTCLSDLSGIAVSIGPGSFTGLRVGLATAKGLATALKKPLVAVPTLEAMASAFPYTSCLVAPMLHARRGEIYWALFDLREGQIVRRHEDRASTPEAALIEISKQLQEGARDFNGVLFHGEGAERHRETILKKMPAQAFFATRATGFPLVSGVADLGFKYLQEGALTLPHLAIPRYLRASSAELKWNLTEGKMRPGSGVGS